jgi:hypothetical protein
MNARIFTAASMAVTFAGVLPARAADPQLVALLMPDVQVVAGVNVDQAKATPFGQYVLNQIASGQSSELQQITAMTGFDPTRDVHELLVGSNNVGAGKSSQTGLVVAKGSFDADRITAAATAGGGTTESYNGATIIEDPQKTHGVAFLSSTLVVAGDIADVKAAIDRQKVPAAIPSTLAVQINQWSTAQDAWAITAMPLSSLHPPQTAPKLPGLDGHGAFQSVQSAAGGVKFGNSVIVTGQAKTDTAQNAQTIGDTIKLLASLAQMQAEKDPTAAALAQSLQVTTSGASLNVTVSLPEDQFEQIVKPKPHTRPAPKKVERKM